MGPAASSARSDDLLQGDHYRITPLTERLVRLEWSPSGSFEDRPTTFALHRDLAAHDHRVTATSTGVRVVTGHYVLDYDRRPFSANGLSVAVRGGVSSYHSVWRYRQDLSLPADRQARYEGRPARSLDGNLSGAARTLDGADGPIPLEPGVNSELGYAVIDDSASMVFDDAGRLAPRDAEPGYQDLYVFAAGHDHVDAVKDLFALSGPQPLLPRFALGNWWSRYHRYSDDEYLGLMNRFAEEGVPLSVAVIDMDWHLTDTVDPKYGSPWTGYTWNRSLFEDPEHFQAELHRRGLKVTLNVHPADGVRAFEEAYEPMCRALGREPDGDPIDFDVTDRAFMDAYFNVLHRGLEQMGTDFWWVDWQSGPYSKLDGMDPLWVLNQGHFADSAAHHERGLTFSRYAGPGSHRYPVGFSGDTVITWGSLAFQPRMTAAGANIGYGWWSHDIGGHLGGYKDDELETRWVEFGVFSPIMRLHSSNSRFSGKEPWKTAEPGRSAIVEHMRLRHRMLPYLNSMNLRAHRDGRSLVEPVYFESQAPEAYRYLDEYLFGSQLLVAPILRPADPVVGRGAADVWLPEGRWVDVVTGHSYAGGRIARMYRDISSIPVLLRAGGFLPLVAEDESLDARNLFPPLEVLVAAGASGRFDLDEETEDGRWLRTRFALDADAGTLTITAPDDPRALRRDWVITLLGSDPVGQTTLEVTGGERGLVEGSSGRLRIELRDCGPQVVLRTTEFSSVGQPVLLSAVDDLLDGARIGFGLKDWIDDLVTRYREDALPSITALGAYRSGDGAEVAGYDRPTPELIEALAELLALEG